MKNKKIRLLQHSLPTGRVFTESQLEEAIKLMDVSVPVEKLIEYGNRCNWLTRQGKSFSNITVFIAAYNGVYLESLRRSGFNKI